MRSHSRAACSVIAALLALFLLPVSSFSHSLDTSPNTSSFDWTSSPTLFARSREYAVLANEDGVPELEPGENAAEDPENILDQQVSPPTKDSPPPPKKPAAEQEGTDTNNNNAPAPSPKKTPVSSPKKTLAPPPKKITAGQGSAGSSVKPSPQKSPAEVEPEPTVEIVNDPMPPPIDQPSIEPEVPGTDGLLGPENAVTVDPPSPSAKASKQPNSQELLGADESLDDPMASSEADVEDVVPQKASVAPSIPNASSSPEKSPKPPKPSPQVTKAAKGPVSSSGSMDTNSPETDQPTVSTVVSFSPKPPSAAAVPSTDAPEVSITPSPGDSQALLAKSPKPQPSKSSVAVLPTQAPSSLDSPSPSVIPEPAVVGEEEFPSPETLLDVETNDNFSPSPSAWDITSGNVAVTAVPVPGVSKTPSDDSAIPPSTVTPGAVATAVIPQPPTSPDETTTPDVTAVVVPPASAGSPAPSIASSEQSLAPSPVPQPVGVTAAPPAPPSEPENTAVVPAPPGASAPAPETATPSVPAVPPSGSPAVVSPSVTSDFPTVVTPSSLPAQSPDAGISDSPSSSEGGGFTCLYFGAGSLPGFSPPDLDLLTGETSQYSVPQQLFPDLAPQYLSHTHGKSWSYAIPAETDATYDFILGFAEVYDAACASGISGEYRKFEIVLGSQSAMVDIMAEVGCGKALKKTFNGITADGGFITAAFQGFGQQAVLNTMCYRTSASGDEPPPSKETPPAQSSSLAEGASGAPDGSIIGPDDGYQCVNFGPKVVGGYTPYDKEAVTGSTFLYLGSGVTQNPELPIPYRYHLYGKEWTYSLDVSSNAAQQIVLGFAEVYPKACASGSEGAFRVFTVSVAGGFQVVDAMKMAGCGAVEQVALENILPQNGSVDVTLSSISGNAMLSVLCFKDMSPAISSPPGDEAPTAVPVAASLTPNPSPQVSPNPDTTEPSSYDSCFSFGDELVDGFAKADVGPGVQFYQNPLATIQGTDYNSVYGSHVFGTQFTFSVQVGDKVPKAVILGFAEVYQPACQEGYRVFTFEAGSNSQTVDVYEEVGCNTAFDIRIDGLVPSPSGLLEISFTSVNNSAMLSAVCVMNEASSMVSNVLPADISAGSGTTANSANTGFGMTAQVFAGLSDATITPLPPNSASGNIEPPSAPETEITTPSAEFAEPSSTPEIETSVPPTENAFPSSEAEAEGSAPSPSSLPNKSPLPKENGVIISLPTDTPEPSQESILVDLGITSEFNGTDPSPVPSHELVDTGLSHTTMGDGDESPSESLTPEMAAAPSQFAVLGGFPGASPSSMIGPTTTPTVSFSMTIASSPAPDTEEDPELSQEADTETETPAGVSTAVGVVPTVTPEVDAPNQPVSATAIPPPGTPTGQSASSSPATQALEEPTVDPSQEPSPLENATPEATPSANSIPNVIVIGSISPEVNDEVAETENPEFESSGDTNTNPETNTLEPSLKPLVTAIPPAGGPPLSDTTTPTAIAPSNEPEFEGSTQSNQGVIVVPQSVSPVISPSVITLIPSPIGLPGVEVLPPVDDTPSPSIIPVPSPTGPQIPAPVPTVTPAPSVSGLPAASPTSTMDVQSDAVGDESTPDGVIPGTTIVPATSPVTSTDPNPQSSPSATPSQIVSTTGTDEVITVATEAPSPDPQESVAAVAPPKPISSAPDNGTGIIEVTDGSPVTDDTVNPDASEAIVAGEFKELIGTRSGGNGFTIGMGILGALLVILLLICLFFAIFRSAGGAYSYSSQYSAHKPTDYGDPSQGGYTEELAPATGEYGNVYSYGQGAQDGYGDAQGTFESRAQTQDGSFTYEGADDTLGGDSGYGHNVGAEGSRGVDTSTYAHTEPDTFNQYASLNMQSQSGYDEYQGAATGEYSFTDTFTMQNTGAFSRETRDREHDDYRDPGPATLESNERSTVRASDSFNADHSIARPITQSESSGKQVRGATSQNMDVGNATFAEGVAVSGVFGTSLEEAHPGVASYSSQRILSISSNPSAAQSPYERNFEMRFGRENSGNVYESDGLNLGAQTKMTERVLVHERNAFSRDRTDTEADDDFLCNVSAPPTGTIEAGDEQWGNLLTNEESAVQNQVSEDGPWPSWWSERKKLTSASRAETEGGNEMDANRESQADDEGEINNENETLSSSGVTGSLFQSYSHPFSNQANNKVENIRLSRQAAPLGTSSKLNVLPVPSHVMPDSGWRRGSATKKTVHAENEDVTNNADFDELRKRREPYVKSVANRLSVGLQSISTSLSGESAFEVARKDFEEEQKALKSNAPRTSSSWITYGMFGS